MAPDAKEYDLLYIYDQGFYNNRYARVDVFEYPGGRLEGQLYGYFAGAGQGLCSDKSGNVYIPEYFGNDVVKVAHGASQSTGVRLRLSGHAMYCAIDPVTGDLAVSESDPSPSSVAIFRHAQGTPKSYTGGSTANNFWALTYDDRGNLFADGPLNGGDMEVGLVELRRHAKKFANVTLGEESDYLGSIQWDGKYLNLLAPAGCCPWIPPKIIRFDVVGNLAKKIGETTLSGAASVGQFVIRDNTVIVPSKTYTRSKGVMDVLRFSYPSGVLEAAMIPDVNEPFGVAFSAARRNN